MEADDGIVLHQHVVCCCLRDAARGEADDDDSALERDALGGPVVHVTAHRIEDDVGAAAASQPLDLLGKILGLVVDRVIGAELPADLGLLIGSGRGDDRRARRLADLNRCAADTAGARMDQ